MLNEATFLGRRTSQNELAIPSWERVLRKVRFKTFIDIGTYNGNFSYYLLLFCKERGAEFYSYDILDHKNKRIAGHFQKLDVFKNENEIGALIRQESISVVFCDGGDKVREVQTFSQYLKPGDIIAVHDYGKEVFLKDIPSGLTMIHVDLIEWNPLTRWFQKDA